MSVGFKAVVLCLLAWSSAGTGAAQTASLEQRAPAVAALAACRLVAADADRLACYDRLVAAFDEAEQAGDVVVVERQQVSEARRALFGFSLGTLPLFSRVGDQQRIEEVQTTLASASLGGSGKWRFVLEDGSVWLQTDSTSLIRPPRRGADIRIREGAVGGYLLSVNGARSMRARRQQ